MNYPLEIKFKLLALAQQLSITDAGGTLLFYVKPVSYTHLTLPTTPYV